MTDAEFGRWFDFHCGLYPSLRTWMEGLENRDAVRAAWMLVLSPLDLNTARDASFRVYREKEQPEGFGLHAGAVARVAKRLLGEREERRAARCAGFESSYRCWRCHDRGVTVILPTVEKLRRMERFYGEEKVAQWKEGGFATMTQAVACSCLEGERYAAVMLRYREAEHWCVVPRPDGEGDLRFPEEAWRELCQAEGREWMQVVLAEAEERKNHERLRVAAAGRAAVDRSGSIIAMRKAAVGESGPAF